MRGHTIPAHVIPDVFNRESMPFPMQGHTNDGTEEKDSGFPLKTGGKDRGGPTGRTEGADGNDKGGPAGVPEGTGGSARGDRRA